MIIFGFQKRTHRKVNFHRTTEERRSKQKGSCFLRWTPAKNNFLWVSGINSLECHHRRDWHNGQSRISSVFCMPCLPCLCQIKPWTVVDAADSVLFLTSEQKQCVKSHFLAVNPPSVCNGEIRRRRWWRDDGWHYLLFLTAGSYVWKWWAVLMAESHSDHPLTQICRQLSQIVGNPSTPWTKAPLPELLQADWCTHTQVLLVFSAKIKNVTLILTDLPGLSGCCCCRGAEAAG